LYASILWPLWSTLTRAIISRGPCVGIEMQSYISPSQYFRNSYKSEVRVPSVPCYNQSPVEAKAVV